MDAATIAQIAVPVVCAVLVFLQKGGAVKSFRRFIFALLWSWLLEKKGASKKEILSILKEAARTDSTG